MAPHSSPLAWKIPWMEEPGGLRSMGSLRVRHDWATSLSLFTFTHWRRKWQPTPVFLPGESQGRRSLVGCRLWGRKESDTAEATQQQQQLYYGWGAGRTWRKRERHPALLTHAAKGAESASGRCQCSDVQSLGILDMGQTGPDIIHKEAGGSASLHTPTLAPPKVPG